MKKHERRNDYFGILPTLTNKSSAGLGSAASDNAHTSLGGPEGNQQTGISEPLKLLEMAAEHLTFMAGLAVIFQVEPPGPAVPLLRQRFSAPQQGKRMC